MKMLPIAIFENINRIPQGQPIDFLIWPITIAGIAALLYYVTKAAPKGEAKRNSEDEK